MHIMATVSAKVTVVKGSIMRVALLSLLILAGVAGAAEEEKEYYPMKLGTTWTYKIDTQVDRLTISTVSTENVGTQECVKFEAKLKNQVIGSEHNAVLKGDVYRFKFGENAIEPPICFLKT